MEHDIMNPTRKLLVTTLAAMAAGLAGATAMAADFGTRTPDVKELVEALTPPERTRGIAIVGASAATKTNASMQVGFELGSAQVMTRDHVKLERLAEALKSETLRDYRYEVIGHTDSTGPLPLNMRLSKERAESVVAYLSKQGVDASRIVADGKGPHELLNKQRPEAAENRRVEVRLIR
jgi:outer membrane protein OmpA-like peptidoglycan-associated protein